MIVAFLSLLFLLTSHRINKYIHVCTSMYEYAHTYLSTYSYIHTYINKIKVCRRQCMCGEILLSAIAPGQSWIYFAQYYLVKNITEFIFHAVLSCTSIEIRIKKHERRLLLWYYASCESRNWKIEMEIVMGKGTGTSTSTSMAGGW